MFSGLSVLRASFAIVSCARCNARHRLGSFASWVSCFAKSNAGLNPATTLST
jgi:hypothetical protein